MNAARDATPPTPGLVVAGVGFSAALTIAAFPPIGAWPLAFVLLAPLVASLRGASVRVAFVAGWAYEFTMAIALVRWIALPLAADFGVAPLRAWTFTIGFVALYALVPAFAIAAWAGLVRTRRIGATGSAVLFAVLTVGAEAVRGGPLLLPWLFVGHAVASAPLWIQVADLGGAAAVSFVVAAVGAAVGMAVSARRWRPLVPAGLLVAATAGYGAWQLDRSMPPGPALDVGIVQASILPRERFRDGTVAGNVERHLAGSRALLEEGPLDLIVWAETSIDATLESVPELAGSLQRFVDDSRTPVLTGAPRRRASGEATNSVVLFVPEAAAPEGYDKQQLVPFVESDPPIATALAPLIGELARDEPYAPGTETTVLRTGPVPLAAPICFEITYAENVRAFRLGGARLLVNVSNDAWFGETGFAEMHLGHVRLRAVELRTWIVRGANTGISALVDPQGRVVASRAPFETGTLRGTVHATDARSLYARTGPVPAWTLLTLVGLGIVFARRR